MRYGDWDVLLFPCGPTCKVPFKEFRVACQVVSDAELSHTHGSPGIPLVTCFVPGVPAGSRFQISVHSWGEPEISSFTRAYSKHVDLVQFEARILIDGCLVATTTFGRTGEWPHLISGSFGLGSNGDFEPLRFPHFRPELIYQNHWNAADDIGRIKVIISEGFPRDSLSVPTERVKNIAAFSFQHAPLNVLEESGIAWPNPSMWRQAQLNSSLVLPTYQSDDPANSHGHSPRRRSVTTLNNCNSNLMQGFSNSGSLFPMFNQPLGMFSANQGFPQGISFVSRSGTGGSKSSSSLPDPLGEAAYYDWVNSLTSCGNNDAFVKSAWPGTGRISSKQSSTDSSMPDYNPSAGQSFLPDTMHISGPSLEDDATPAGIHMKVPTNTPTSGHETGRAMELPVGRHSVRSSMQIPNDLATSLTQSLLNQPLPLPVSSRAQPQHIPPPASEVKGRKENRQPKGSGSNPLVSYSTGKATENYPFGTRNISQPIFAVVSSNSTTPSLGDGGHLINKATGIHSNSTSSTAVTGASPIESTSGSPTFQQPSLSASNPGSRIGSTSTVFEAVEILATQSASNVVPLGEASASGLNTAAINTSGSAPRAGDEHKTISLRGTPASGSGTKRGRTYTPASVHSVDDEDEPRRVSPSVRMASQTGELQEE